MSVGKRFAGRTLLASLALASQVLFAQAPRSGAPGAPAMPGAGQQQQGKPAIPGGNQGMVPPQGAVGNAQGPSQGGGMNQPPMPAGQQQVGNGAVPVPGANGAVPVPGGSAVQTFQPANAQVPTTIRGENADGRTLP